MAFNFKNLIYWLYPKHCPFCKTVISKNLVICDNCNRSIKREINIRKILIEGFNKEVICIAPFSYKDKIRTAICDYKFKGYLDYSDLFSKEISDVYIRYFKDIDFITSVPLHKNRQKERGFNQSEVLASKIGKIINVPHKELLVKCKSNKVQHNLPKYERVENVKGVYAVADKVEVYGKNILLCDDIITTGNTLKECAKVLLKAGAKDVYCVTTASSNLED